jgi:Family of unknown function (DUF6011)
MSAVLSTCCSVCGKDLTDPLSRRYGIGPDCRRDLSPAQLADALRANQPGYIPRARPASATAHRNHAEIERVTANVVADKQCEHGDRPAACPLCRRDNDPARCAERVIAVRQRMPRGERLEAERAAARRMWGPR